MSGDITSDNIQLSEPTQTATAPIADDCTGIFRFSSACDDPEVLRFVTAARSTNTQRAYQDDLAHFIALGRRDSRRCRHHRALLGAPCLRAELGDLGASPGRDKTRPPRLRI